MKKSMNETKKNNKGFSLVELIVVIAIMVVLVAVLAPVFTKYVEQSRRATDVQNANTIAEAVLVEAADGAFDSKVDSDGEYTSVVAADTLTTIASAPEVKGTLPSGVAKTFTFEYNQGTNTVKVFITGTTLDLTNETNAALYKNASSGTMPSETEPSN